MKTRFRFYILFCFVLSLSACSAKDKNASIKELYKKGKYESVVEKKAFIKDSVDTALYIVSCSKTKQFDAVEPFVQHLKSYRNYYGLVFPDTTGMTKEQKSKVSFPFEKYTSLELYYMAHYFYHYLKVDKYNEYEDFLRQSLRADTTNAYALYDYAKEELASKEYELSAFLLKRLLAKDPTWERAKDMLAYVENKLKIHSKKYKLFSISQYLNTEIPHGEYDPKYEEF